jgi:hypothetical protein
MNSVSFDRLWTVVCLILFLPTTFAVRALGLTSPGLVVTSAAVVLTASVLITLWLQRYLNR